MAIKRWEPDDFQVETSTVWRFPEHGSWATHDSSYRGNWSPYVPRNLLLRYSREGDIVLDQFCGGGTTMVECRLLNRIGVGSDVNVKALQLTAKKCNFDRPGCGKVYLHESDARNLNYIPNEKIDFICTHPPYADIIKYSKGIPADISLLSVRPFLKEMEKVAHECYRVLKRGKFCAILMGDLRQHGCVIPLGFKVMSVFEKCGFTLKELIIKEQYNCRHTAEWVERSKKFNFLLLAHEHLMVFRK